MEADVFNFNIREERIMYYTILNKLCLRIDHDRYKYMYHGCEFVREIIYRNFQLVNIEYTAIPAYMIPTFLEFINRDDCDDLDFCNFLCCREIDIQIYTPGLDTYPAEIDKINKGMSRVVFTKLLYSQEEYRLLVYNFLYKLYKNSDVLTELVYRKLVYKMAKIFKHKVVINEPNPNEKVIIHFNNCVSYLIKHQNEFRVYETTPVDI